MSHAHHHDRHPAPRKMGMKHAFKLFLLNAVLYGACSAFAGLIIGDALSTVQQPRLIVAVGVVPLVLAVISTVLHLKAHAWTSVDDMAERFVHPHQHSDRTNG